MIHLQLNNSLCHISRSYTVYRLQFLIPFIYLQFLNFIKSITTKFLKQIIDNPKSSINFMLLEYKILYPQKSKKILNTL